MSRRLSRTFRRGEAVARSESITRKPSLQEAKALSDLTNSPSTGTRTRRDCCDASNRIFFQLSGFFDRPFECVKLHDGQQQHHVHAGLNGSQLLDQCELDAIAADTFDPAEPHSFAVTQLIELARLGAQHTSQVMRRVTFHDGSLACKMFNEESSSHAEILSQEECY